MEQLTLWGEAEEIEQPLSYDEKIQQAKDAMRLAADISMKYYNAPLIVTYSGGKDSDVMLDIAMSCLEPDEMEVLHSHTTVDAPETVRHIEKVFKYLDEVGIKASYHNRYPVKKTMWSLIVENRMPPTRIARYCCEALKETTTPNRAIAIGVREDESTGRKGRNSFAIRGGARKEIIGYWSLEHAQEVFEDAKEYDEVFDCTMVTKAKEKADLICSPIYKMTEQDIWRYIHENELEVNPLYRMGYKRVGCIGCPLGGRKQILKGFNDYPKYKLNYIRAFDRMLKARKESGKDDVTGKEGSHAWHTGKDVFDWWIQNYAYIPKGQMNLFDGEEDTYIDKRVLREAVEALREEGE